ncbi:TPA_exp: Uncharacterized protein A8136_6348 [Trichophyton benhamiae CBS 112371]|uniref:Uncharacterized protein n=1 Tax=Arthroderma benhamiae (strain ATCC MYA-4681 / CBS 112371) TaxID=663331 RepID=D4B5S5_ARTBC|nr:uncharacterized protein ARB_03832 [Trichophyton benhamiae CBS 112371]EFE29261.1 conserved hypothetical protein [Trichophyton benhamiae CBS 112371]DAA72545.1 TPA_exp: Uncharacterized protein A8136_6348 [Trichophyton benhamiae CBS 112371]
MHGVNGKAELTISPIGAQEDVIAVCDEQPLPVAPMKLVLYDDIPSSPRRADSRASLLPNLVTETRSLASRASNRASLLVKHKKRSKTTPVRKLKISGPTDFRHLTAGSTPTPRRRRRSFRPLELSIYVEGNQLPDLPAFDTFGLDDFDLEGFGQASSRSTGTTTDSTTDPILAPPPKAVCMPDQKDDRRRSESTSSPFAVARKPIGTSSARNSLFIEVHDRRHTIPDPEKLQEIQNAISPPRRSSETLNGYPLSSLEDLTDLKQTESEITPSSVSPSKGRNSSSVPIPTHYPTRSRTIAEWFAAKSHQGRPPSSFRFDTSHARARTLSGSTMVSLANASTAGYSSRNPSLSSSVMMGTTTQSPLSFHALTEKDYEICDIAMGYKTSSQEACSTPNEKRESQTLTGKDPYYEIPLGPNDIGVAY